MQLRSVPRLRKTVEGFWQEAVQFCALKSGPQASAKTSDVLYFSLYESGKLDNSLRGLSAS